ncbi:hypothetical protein K1X84_10485 [bacterium]|nr:hypothetical protein [bacterium]
MEKDKSGNSTEYVYGPTGIIFIKTATQTNFVLKDHLGSIRATINTAELPYAAVGYDYSAFGTILSTVSNSGYFYTGQEYDKTSGLHNFKARMYDSDLAMFYGVDAAGQTNSPFAYVGNNPVIRKDKDGNFFFVPILIGAAIGGYSGYQIGKAKGAKGWDMFGYIAGGSLIGGLSGGAAAGMSAAGGGALLSGASAGAVGGAGFNGLASNWKTGAMLNGAWKGALSGFVSGGVGSAIGGGSGAFAGGAVGSGLNTALNGGKGRDIISSMATGGALSYGTYELSSYVNWKYGGGNNLGGHKLSYTQYKTMQADFQRSAFWGKEYGGFLMKDGSVQRLPAQFSHGLGEINVPAEADGFYHTHWDSEGQTFYIDQNGQKIETGFSGKAWELTTTRDHSPSEYVNVDSYVVNRYGQVSVHLAGFDNHHLFNDPFLRYFPWFIWP